MVGANKPWTKSKVSRNKKKKKKQIKNSTLWEADDINGQNHKYNADWGLPCMQLSSLLKDFQTPVLGDMAAAPTAADRADSVTRWLLRV